MKPIRIPDLPGVTYGNLGGGGTGPWSLHLCELEKCPPHRISGRVLYAIHIITRLRRTEGRPSSTGGEGPLRRRRRPPPREAAGETWSALERLGPSAQRAPTGFRLRRGGPRARTAGRRAGAPGAPDAG